MVFSGLESVGSKYTVFLYSCFAPGSNSFFDASCFTASSQTDGGSPSTRRNIVENRYKALMALRLMVRHDLLTDAELSVLSEAALEEIANVVRQPYKLEWIEEIARED